MSDKIRDEFEKFLRTVDIGRDRSGFMPLTASEVKVLEYGFSGGWKAAIAQQPAPVAVSAVHALLDSDSVPDDFRNQASGYRAGWNDCLAAPAAPAQVAKEPVLLDYPHEEMDAIALARYRVGASGAGTLHKYAVRAGGGEQELWRGSNSDCEAVARKLAGAFLDGGMCMHGLLYAPPPAAEQPDTVACLEALIDKWRAHAKMLRKDKQQNVADMADDCADELSALLAGGEA